MKGGPKLLLLRLFLHEALHTCIFSYIFVTCTVHRMNPTAVANQLSFTLVSHCCPH